MRKVVASTYVTLNGVSENPQDWSSPFFNDEAGKYASDLLFASDTLLMGRRTYESFAEAWPDRDGDFADKINGMRKYVVSSTLDKPEWNNSTVIKPADTVAEVAKLKQEPGKNILMYGFGPVARTLLRNDLLDELRFWVHPVFVGSANPDDQLAPNGFGATLKLVETETLSTGVVILAYRPAEGDAGKAGSD